MALAGTTTELLVAIRDDARVANDEPDATDAILLAEATRILHRTYVPAVRKCRSDYYLSTSLTSLEVGRARYPIPRRATTSTVRRVRILDDSGKVRATLQPVSIEDIDQSTGSCPSVYAITDSSLTVWPTPNAATYTLEIMFEYRPGTLILPEDALERVVAVTYDTSADLWSIATITDELSDGEVFDIVRADSPFSVPVIDAVANATGSGIYGYTVQLASYMGVHPVGVTGTGWLSAPSPIGVQTADYICNAGESPLPQIPLELHPCLAMHTAAKFLRPIDPQGADELQRAADADMVQVLEAMTPRKQGNQQKMRPRVRNVMTGGGWGRRGGTFGDIG